MCLAREDAWRMDMHAMLAEHDAIMHVSVASRPYSTEQAVPRPRTGDSLA